MGPVILNTPIHVMPGPLNYNILLGRPRLHTMHVVPSTLHHKVKLIHKKLMYTLHEDDAPNPCLNVEYVKIYKPLQPKKEIEKKS